MAGHSVAVEAQRVIVVVLVTKMVERLRDVLWKDGATCCAPESEAVSTGDGSACCVPKVAVVTSEGWAGDCRFGVAVGSGGGEQRWPLQIRRTVVSNVVYVETVVFGSGQGVAVPGQDVLVLRPVVVMTVVMVEVTCVLEGRLGVVTVV